MAESGAAVRPAFEPSFPAQLFRALAGGADGAGFVGGLPSESASWYSYGIGSTSLPMFIALLGTCAAAFTALNLCRPAPARKTANSMPYLFGAGLFVAILWLSALVSLSESLHGFGSASAALRDAAGAALQAQEDLETMNQSATQLHIEMGGLLTTCHGLEKLMRLSMGGESVNKIERLQTSIAGDILGLRSLLERMRPGVAALEGLLESASARLQSWPRAVRRLALAPAKTFAVSAVAVAAVFAAHAYGGPAAEAVETAGLGRLAAGFSFLTILVASWSAAALVGLGGGAGAFCAGGADQAVLAAVGSSARGLGAEVLMGNVARSYVLGRGSNPLLVDLAEAEHRAQGVQAALIGGAPLLDSLGLYCPQVLGLHLNQTSEDLHAATVRDLVLLADDAMYDRYSKAVHQGFCGAHLDSLGWVAFFNCFLSLVGLPAVAALARPYIGQGAGKDPVAENPYGRVGFLDPEMAMSMRCMPNSYMPARQSPQLAPPPAYGGRLLGAEASPARTARPSIGPPGSGVSGFSSSKPGSGAEDWTSARNAATPRSGAPSALDSAASFGDVEYLREASRQGTPVSTWDFARAHANALVSSVTGNEGPSTPGDGRPSLAPSSLSRAMEVASGSPGSTAHTDPMLAGFTPKKKFEETSSFEKKVQFEGLTSALASGAPVRLI